VVNRGILRELMLNEIAKFDNAKMQRNAQVKVVDLRVVKEQQRSEHDTTIITSIVEVTLQNGQTFKGDVLLGCDGIFSNI
jgi:2-polyprenyl-6-methoxyphenol hydroxylase-like FAD-dependent oxidoreductase